MYRASSKTCMQSKLHNMYPANDAKYCSHIYVINYRFSNCYENMYTKYKSAKINFTVLSHETNLNKMF